MYIHAIISTKTNLPKCSCISVQVIFNVALPVKWSHTIARQSLTCPAICVFPAVSGTRLDWVDMSAKSTSGLTVTLEPPVTKVSTARAKTTFRLIIMCRKWSDATLKENTSSVEDCRQGTDPAVRVPLCNTGRGSKAKTLSRSWWLPVYILPS